MRLRFWIVGLTGVALIMNAGCGMKARVYAVDRPRVDQANMGNAGYLSGDKTEGVVSSDQPERKTRRIYVFEIDKKKKIDSENKSNKSVEVQSTASHNEGASESDSASPAKAGITIPYIGDEQAPAQVTELPVNVGPGMSYTVVKDDTLQKISKKVYGTFGKWTKIYDANKDKIKNPNFVKPGTVLTIPAVD